MIDKNDPRLTAYALGELEADAAAAFEAALTDDAAAQAEVSDIRRAADDLRLALADECAPALTDDQRETIRASAARSPAERRRARLHLLYWTVTAAAACLVIAFALRPRGGTGLQYLPLARQGATEAAAPPHAAADVLARHRTGPAATERNADAVPGPVAEPEVAMAATGTTGRAEEDKLEAPAAGPASAAAATAFATNGATPLAPDVQRDDAVAMSEPALAANLSGPAVPPQPPEAGAAPAEPALFMAAAPAPAMPPASAAPSVRAVAAAPAAEAAAGAAIGDTKLTPAAAETGNDTYAYAGAAGAGTTAPVATFSEKESADRLAAPAAAPEAFGMGGAGLNEATRAKAMQDSERTLLAAGQPAGRAAGRQLGEPPVLPRDVVAARRPAPVVAAKSAAAASGPVALAVTQQLDRPGALADSRYDSPFRSASEAPQSSFDLAVDTSSYTRVRYFLNQGQLPPQGAVQIEGLVNHFNYAGAPPVTGRPFSVRTEVAACPWKPGQRLVRIAVSRGGQTAPGQESASGKAVAALGAALKKGLARPAAAAAAGAPRESVIEDLKLQVAFSPARVAVYRLIGNEGDLAAVRPNEAANALAALRPGQTVNAFYQVIPVPAAAEPDTAAAAVAKGTPPGTAGAGESAATTANLVTVTLRWRPEAAGDAGLLEVPVPDRPLAWEQTSRDMQFGSAVALFGMLLRQSPYAAGSTFDTVLALAERAADHGTDRERTEFLDLVRQAKATQQVAP
jgi:hypothetical protein